MDSYSHNVSMVTFNNKRLVSERQYSSGLMRPHAVMSDITITPSSCLAERPGEGRCRYGPTDCGQHVVPPWSRSGVVGLC